MCNKITLSKKECEEAIKKVKKSSKQYRKENRYYYCEEHNGWHLSSHDYGEAVLPINAIYEDKWKRLLEDAEKHMIEANNYIKEKQLKRYREKRRKERRRQERELQNENFL